MAEVALESFTLSNRSNYWKLYADAFSKGKFFGAKVTRTWLDKETKEQTERRFTFSAGISELKEVQHNLGLLVAYLEKKSGMQTSR